MGGRSGGATAKGGRFKKGGGSGASRMGKVGYVSDWEDLYGGGQWRDVRIDVNSSATGSGYIDMTEYTPGSRGDTSGWLNVVYTASLRREDKGKGLGMGMYLAGLKYAKDNNLGFRSDSTVSAEARVVWNSLAARGVNVRKRAIQLGHVFTISPRDVQNVDINALNRGRKTTAGGGGQRPVDDAYNARFGRS